MLVDKVVYIVRAISQIHVHLETSCRDWVLARVLGALHVPSIKSLTKKHSRGHTQIGLDANNLVVEMWMLGTASLVHSLELGLGMSFIITFNTMIMLTPLPTWNCTEDRSKNYYNDLFQKLLYMQYIQVFKPFLQTLVIIKVFSQNWPNIKLNPTLRMDVTS